MSSVRRHEGHCFDDVRSLVSDSLFNDFCIDGRAVTHTDLATYAQAA